MKTTAYLLCAWVQACCTLMATPDRGTTISDSFLGSGTECFELIKQGRVAGLEDFIGSRLPLVPSRTFSVLVEDQPK